MALEKGHKAGDLQITISAIADSATKSIENMIDSLSRLQNQMAQTMAVLKADGTSFTKTFKNFSKNGFKELLDQQNKSSNSTAKSLSFFKGIGKIAMISKGIALAVKGAVRFGKEVAKIAQKGADYTETLNLWEVAMRDNVGVASEFVNKMNEAYGISKKTLMNAQAIFKNMLGSLGQISDQMAYNLSEGITQMAVDYASLYNVGFEDAFTKFQAALSGQVRPIRSVSGYDITENTIYQLYKELGGTKSVRNLQRTEKQLLGLLAIFDQMQASGAIGDLSKTMESFANQSRVAKESFSDILSYGGAIITKLLETSGFMTAFNGILLFVVDVLEAVAESIGALEGFGGAKPFESITESAEGAENAIDKVNGKLLDFDKFRSMSGGEENALGLDQKLLDALSGYSSILDNMNSSANQFAENLKKASGFFNEDGGLNKETLKDVFTIISAVANLIGRIITALKPLMPIIIEITDIVTNDIAPVFLDLIGALIEEIAPVLQPVLKMVKDIFAFVSRLLPIVTNIVKVIATALQILTPILNIISGLLNVALKMSDVVFGVIFYLLIPAVAFLELILKIVTTIVEVVRTLFTFDWAGLGSRLENLWSKWSASDLSKAYNKTYLNIDSYAVGASNLEGGSLFVAGEHGKTEMVYSGANGKGNVANIQQIKQAQLQALNEWWSNARRDMPQVREVSKTGIYEITKSEAIRRGDW